MKLYTYFRSSAAFRVRIALNLKGLPYESVPIHLIKDGGRNKTPEYRAINPQMKVPSLVLDDGQVLTQSPQPVHSVSLTAGSSGSVEKGKPFMSRARLLERAVDGRPGH